MLNNLNNSNAIMMMMILTMLIFHKSIEKIIFKWGEIYSLKKSCRIYTDEKYIFYLLEKFENSVE